MSTSSGRRGRTANLVTIGYKRAADAGEGAQMQGVRRAELVTIGYMRSSVASSSAPSEAPRAASSRATRARGATIR